MSSELAIYKQNRIIGLQNTYNSTVAALLASLNANTRVIQNSRLSVKVKQTNINNLNIQYNANVNNLKIALNKNISLIQNFIPKPITINKNKDLYHFIAAMIMGLAVCGMHYTVSFR